MSINLATVILALLVLYIAYSAVKSGRKKKRYYGQTFDDPQPPGKSSAKRTIAEPVEDVPKPISTKQRIGLIVFLTIWLTMWSVGVYLALVTRIGMSYGEEGFIFLTIWLGMAIPAWFFVAWTLFRLIRGDHVDVNFDGDGDGGGDGGGD